MGSGWQKRLAAGVLIAAAAILCRSPAIAGDEAAASARWQWLAQTIWYVPKQYLLALASSPAIKTPLPVSDQTVYYISDFSGGYFWGTTAVSYRRLRSAGSTAPSCLQLVGSVTPEGKVHLTFTLFDPKPLQPGGSTGEPTVGVGVMARRGDRWTMENQMSTIAVGDVLLTHWAFMHQCQPSEPCFAELPGVKVSVPEFLGPCLRAVGRD